MARRRPKGQRRPPMAKRRRPPLWHLALSGSLIVATVLLILYTYREKEQARSVAAPAAPPTVAKVEQAANARDLAILLYKQVDAALEELGLWPELLDKRHGTPDTIAVQGHGAPDTIAVQVPADLPLAMVNLQLTQLVERCGGKVLRAVEKRRHRHVEMRCGLDSTLTTLFVLKRTSIRRKTGRIAIVLDDFGYLSWNDRLIERFCALPQSLTLAILPNEGKVKDIVDLIQRHNHEVLIHLPMEPENYPEKNPGEDAIFTTQDDATIRQLVRAAIRRIPGAVGLNNHMGSKATADVRVMEQVLAEVKKNNLLFLDSRTTAASVAYGTALALDIPALQRDLFIDTVDETAAIEARLWELAELAAAQGQAIGIGHDREHTLLALESILPRLETRGFLFVPLSQLTD